MISTGTMGLRGTFRLGSSQPFTAATLPQKKAAPMEDDDDRGSKHQMSQSAQFETPLASRDAPGLPRSVQSQLGQRLRHFYESLALGETPVPDRFIELINRLDDTPAENKPS